MPLRHNFTGLLIIDFLVLKPNRLGNYETAEDEYNVTYDQEVPEGYKRVWQIEDSNCKVIATYNSLQRAVDSIHRTAQTLELEINEKNLEQVTKWLEEQNGRDQSNTAPS